MSKTVKIRGKEISLNYIANGCFTTAYEDASNPEDIYLFESTKVTSSKKAIANCLPNKHIPAITYCKKVGKTAVYKSKRYTVIAEICNDDTYDSDVSYEYADAVQTYKLLDAMLYGQRHRVEMEKAVHNLFDRNLISGDLYHALLWMIQEHYNIDQGWAFDIHSGNVAVDEDGTIILLDIFFRPKDLG